MKTVMMILSYLLATQAFAGEITKSNLEIVRFDSKLELPPPSAIDLRVNEQNKTVTLAFILPPHACPAPAECFFGQMTNNITLPIVSISKDSCNVVHIIAKQDLRTVDGDLQELNVTDNSNDTCFSMTLGETVVEYTTDGFDHLHNAGSIQTDSLFKGPALK